MKKYFSRKFLFSIKGRLNRKDYVLFNLVFLSLISLVVILRPVVENISTSLPPIQTLSILPLILLLIQTVLLALFLILLAAIIYILVACYIFGSISTTIKRLHDFNFSGWWLFFAFILFVILCLLELVMTGKLESAIDSFDELITYNLFGSIFALLLIFKKGTVGKNKFGEGSIKVV